MADTVVGSDDLRLPPLPEFFTDKLKQIDPQGTEQKQKEIAEWYRKLAHVLRS